MPKKSRSSAMPMNVKAMKVREAMMEQGGGRKMPAETMMERRISKATGKTYKGKRG